MVYDIAIPTLLHHAMISLLMVPSITGESTKKKQVFDEWIFWYDDIMVLQWEYVDIAIDDGYSYVDGLLMVPSGS